MNQLNGNKRRDVIFGVGMLVVGLLSCCVIGMNILMWLCPYFCGEQQ